MGSVVDDVLNFVDDIAGTEFGSEEQWEDAQNAAPPPVNLAASPITTAAEVMEKRKKEKDTRAAEIAQETAGDTSKVAGMRKGTGNILSGKGKEKQRLRSQKFKQSKPLRIGMKRPK